MRERSRRPVRAGALAAGLCLVAPFIAMQNAVAADMPPNPTTKDGYTLDFQEEFDGTSLDTNKWLPYYLPHFAQNREDAKARYTVKDGKLVERLDPDTPAWSPKYDGTVRVSSIQTYNRDWWHRFKPSVQNDHHEQPFNGYTTKYGYVEMRAKLSDVGGGGHQALWMVGTEDQSQASENPEIDMLESFFSKPSTWRIAAYGMGDPDFLGSWTLHEDSVPSGEPTKEYHLYGMEWTPTQLKFYYDNQLYKTINDAPNMGMGLILGIYTDAGSGTHNEVWPKTWSVDYLRVWKKNGGYDDTYRRFKNRNNNQYMHIEDRTGKVQYGTVPASWWSSQWQRETVDGRTRYKNRWTGEYLHTEADTGSAQHGAIPGTAWSSQWAEERTEGYVRFRNRNTGQYLHTQNSTGYVQTGAVPRTYWSSQWKPEVAP